MAVQSDSFPCRGSASLYVRHRALRMPCLAALAAAALVVVLALARAPAVYAGPSHTVALTAIQAAMAQYVVGYVSTPDIGASLSVSPQYVAPWVWDGEDPDDPEFEPETVEITATAADQDTMLMWYPWFPYIVPILVLDPISVHNLAGPAGFTITQPWFGTTVEGEFSTVHCGAQQAACVTKAITWEADDQAMYGEGSDDATVEMTENVHVVLPNAATTEWLDCIVAQIGELNVHMGDAWTHSLFYTPGNLSPQEPAPAVSFSRYYVMEGEWELLGVEGGLDEGEVQHFFEEESRDWDSVWIVDETNSFVDFNWMNRWVLSLRYGLSLRQPGLIRLKQGFRVIHPNSGPLIQENHVVELHFVGTSDGPESPGECYVRKEGDSKTSDDPTWQVCPNFPE